MPHHHYPKDRNRNDSVAEINLGLNLTDNILKTKVGEAVVLQNMQYERNTPIKRDMFSQKSTETWSGEGRFRGGHEYIDRDNTSRLLFGVNTGKIVEFTNASSSSERVTGLTVGGDIRFTDNLGRVVAVNGNEAPRVGEGASWRIFGAIAKVTDLAVAASGSGSFTGTYLHIVIPVKEISADVAEIYGDWSNIISTVAASDGQFDLTWSDIVDSRITKYWVFRTKVGVGAPFFRVARVAPAAEAYTDTTADASLSAQKPPALGTWGTAPISKYVAFSGNRIVMAHLLDNADEENALHVSQLSSNSFDTEAYNTQGAKIFVPGGGPITGILGVGETGEESRRTNHLFIGQPKSAWLLPETDTKQRIIEISGEVGLINDRAIAQWNSYIFWVDRKRGLVFWRVGQDSPWEIGDKIAPIFFGGGNQTLTKNQTDANITLEVWNDQLLITVRDDNTKTGANKTYLMDLTNFQPVDRITAEQTARFTGPWTGPGMDFYVALADRELVLFDSENNEILKNDTTAIQDYIGGTNTNAQVKILSGAFLKESLRLIKTPHFAYIYHFTDNVPIVRLRGEFDKEITDINISVVSYSLEWDDIVWDDLTWLFPAFQAEGPVNFGTHAKFWQLEIIKDDTDNNYAFFGFALTFSIYKPVVTFN